MSKNTSARRPRSLRDIGVLGTVLVVPDPEAEDGQQVVWLQKLNPADHDAAIRKANAARARAKASFADHDGDDYLSVHDEISGRFPRDQMIELLLGEDARKLEESVESELLLGEDDDGEPTEWGKDNYLQGLQQAWAEIRERYVEDEDDPEARRVLDEITRFSERVHEIVDPQIADLRAQFELAADEDLRERTVELWVRFRCEQAWAAEFERCELWLGTRKPCEACLAGEKHNFLHEDFYFGGGLKDINALSEDMLALLLSEYHQLVTEVGEGKDSPASPASSDSSAPPESSVTEPTSGPEAAVA